MRYSYDRTAAVMDLETVLSTWMRQAAGVLEREILAKGGFDLRRTRISTAPQSNGIVITIDTALPMDSKDRKSPRVPTRLEISLFLAAGAEFEAFVSADFHGGEKSSKSFRYTWSADVGTIGSELGQWIRSMEPIAPV